MCIRDRHRKVGTGEEADDAERDRDSVRVGHVVGERPRHRACEVAEHREIGCKGEDDQEPPRVTEMEVEGDRGHRDDRTFDVQEKSRDATGHLGIVDRRLVWKAAPHEYGSIPSAEPDGHV